MVCSFCQGSIFEPSPFYRALAFEFDTIEAIEAYNRTIGIGTALLIKSCGHIYHSLCLYRLNRELSQRKPQLRAKRVSCFVSGCTGNFKFWEEIVVYPLDHLLSMNGEVTVLSNQAVTLLKRNYKTKEQANKKNLSIGIKSLDYYYTSTREQSKYFYTAM